ncbi:hypothetical protein EDF79_3064 [Raoultella terrigena]|nr:hypothetical protein EDF79_3064 [Raoultella terrigena]
MPSMIVNIYPLNALSHIINRRSRIRIICCLDKHYECFFIIPIVLCVSDNCGIFF